jgi:uncharacterized protein (TIGR03437 family)
LEFTDSGKMAVRAPRYFVTEEQINFQIPFGTAAARVEVRVRTAAGLRNPDTVPIASRAPPLFPRTRGGK